VSILNELILLRVDSGRAVVFGADPDITKAIFENGIDVVAGQTVGVFGVFEKMLEAIRLFVVTVEVAIGAGPDNAVAVFEYLGDKVARYRARAFFEELDVGAVVTDQPIKKRTEPEKTVAVLCNGKGRLAANIECEIKFELLCGRKVRCQ
jgi:hypothetical protein